MSEFAALRGVGDSCGWSDDRRAANYVELFASASDQVIDPLLNAVGAKAGHKALDLCCGQGNVSEASPPAAAR